MKRQAWVLALACTVSLAGATAAVAGGAPGTSSSAGTLRTPAPEAVRGQALAWLQSTGQAGPAALKQFEALWAQDYRPLLDRVADTLALADPRAARLLEEARDPLAPAPTRVPSLLTDESQPAFVRSNLALAYARSLSNRRIYEEALAALRSVRPDQVVDPAAYFFHRAVAEYALGLKADAARSIAGLTEDVADAPERYKLLAALMSQDLQGWREKDLGDVARKMDNVERRLELARGGPRTQKIERQVVARLDELIKRLENQMKGPCNGGCCPSGGSSGGAPGSAAGMPMGDSMIAPFAGRGVVDKKRLSSLAKEWGKLPEKERTKAMLELTRDLPPRHREVIENYIKKISSVPNGP